MEGKFTKRIGELANKIDASFEKFKPEMESLGYKENGEKISKAELSDLLETMPMSEYIERQQALNEAMKKNKADLAYNYTLNLELAEEAIFELETKVQEFNEAIGLVENEIQNRMEAVCAKFGIESNTQEEYITAIDSKIGLLNEQLEKTESPLERVKIEGQITELRNEASWFNDRDESLCNVLKEGRVLNDELTVQKEELVMNCNRTKEALSKKGIDVRDAQFKEVKPSVEKDYTSWVEGNKLKEEVQEIQDGEINKEDEELIVEDTNNTNEETLKEEEEKIKQEQQEEKQVEEKEKEEIIPPVSSSSKGNQTSEKVAGNNTTTAQAVSSQGQKEESTQAKGEYVATEPSNSNSESIDTNINENQEQETNNEQLPVKQLTPFEKRQEIANALNTIKKITSKGMDKLDSNEISEFTKSVKILEEDKENKYAKVVKFDKKTGEYVPKENYGNFVKELFSGKKTHNELRKMLKTTSKNSNIDLNKTSGINDAKNNINNIDIQQDEIKSMIMKSNLQRINSVVNYDLQNEEKKKKLYFIDNEEIASTENLTRYYDAYVNGKTTAKSFENYLIEESQKKQNENKSRNEVFGPPAPTPEEIAKAQALRIEQEKNTPPSKESNDLQI